MLFSQVGGGTPARTSDTESGNQGEWAVLKLSLDTGGGAVTGTDEAGDSPDGTSLVVVNAPA